LDWLKYDIVLDFPSGAKDIYIYLMTQGKGRVWFDDATLSVADGNVPVTNLLRFTEPGNTGFEDGLARWGIASTGPSWFELSTDGGTKYEGNASAVISSTYGTERENASSYLSQLVATDIYKGKKVRFSAQIKTENVEDQAELWIGVRDLAGADMSPDTIGSDKGKGTVDWREYQAVINVPDDSLFFLMFVGLNGKGKMWVDDVRLEVVGDYVPPTNAAP
jgi:hypothetical protein